MAWKKGYEKENRIVELVQACRTAKLSYPEAMEFFKSHGVEPISEPTFIKYKKFLEESVEARIQHIAKSEYADMHVQLIDNSKYVFTTLKVLAEKSFAENDMKTLQWVSQELRYYSELLKDLYAASPIVGKTQEIIRKKFSEIEDLHKRLDKDFQ